MQLEGLHTEYRAGDLYFRASELPPSLLKRLSRERIALSFFRNVLTNPLFRNWLAEPQ